MTPLVGLSLVLNILLIYRLFLEWRERRRAESSLRGFRQWNEGFMDAIQADQKEFIKTYLEYQRSGTSELREWLGEYIDKMGG